ncbi:hemicentin-1-like isoform X2 [Mytilus californianus]|uniref:hemicentin-1-like isoform X2 n=1 Tax=Mytilus californianus TaxID=6549 RepID=UPI0022479CB7|nr:hemicentin-1-like isoform X2 [Mytilus californianus]
MKSKHSLLYIQLLVNTVCCIYGRQENLLFSTEHKVKKIDLDTGVVKDLANLDTIVHSIAYDVKERYVYVPRGGENVIVRFPYPNDDQTVNFETVIYTDRPYYVSFDSKNSHLYWTEQEKLEKIMRCNSDGSNLTIIVKEFSLTAFTLDTHHRWIYYSTKSSYALHRVTFDGNEKRIVMKLTALAIDIEIDFVDKRVYWIEYEKGDLKSALYNGSDVKTVVSTNVNLNSREIDIGGEYVFYTSSNTILKIHKSSGQIPTVVHTDTRQIYGLLFYKQEDIPIVTVTHNAYNRTYGYNVTLECMIDSYPNHTNVYWQHIYNETVLNITSDSPGVYGSTVTDPSLTILQVTLEGSGQYICFAVNVVGTGKSEPTTLAVFGDIPIVTIKHDVYNRTYGYNVTLECMIDSYPNHTNVYWQHIYNETVLNITSDSPGVYGSTVTNPSLTILQVSSEESGQYICFAVNIVGTGKSVPTTLTVLGDIPIVTIENAVYNRTYGNNVTLKCMIDSSPYHTHVYWQHIFNETVSNITSDSPGVYGSTVTDPSLTLLQVSWNESGQYICFAVNIVGNGKSESTVLIVLGDIPIVTITNAVYNRTYGDNVTLECKIDSSPNHSHVYWQHIYNETVFNVTSDSPFVYGATVTNPSLTLLQLSSEESGHYICFAVNIVGTGKSEPTTLTILGEQKDLVVNVEKDRYIVMYGRSLTLECSVHTARQSPPVREIYWQYNNNGVLTTIVKDTDGISGSSIEVPSLTILDVTTSESGIYICFAKTNNGTGQSRPINVTVIGDEPIVNVGDTISSTRYGENITLFCNITANPKVTHVYWEKEVNGTKNVLNSWTVGIRGASVETPSLTIMKSTTADAGNYKCVATNDVGTGNSETISLKVIGKLPTVSVTPVLQPVNYGESVNITCGVNANPPATIVYWEKKSNGFIKVMNNETTGTAGITVENPSMTLLHATDSDSGYYKCFAVNEFGLGYSSSVRLTVIGGLPEVSVPSLKYLTGTGHTISISCFVKNTSPEVSKVYWKRYLHGSSTIISSTSIGIKGVTVENPSLIIPSAMESMTGEYTCFAVNSVGTGSSLPAKLTVTTGFIPVVNSEDSHSIKSNSNTVVSITIAAVGAIAAVGSAIVACCSYRLNHRSGNQSESQQPSSSTELNASTGNGDVENMNNSRQQIRSSINNPRPPSSTGSSTNAKRDV